MSRAIHLALFLALLMAAIAGCDSKPKDEIPTQLKMPPKEPPASGKGEIFPKQRD